MASERRLPLPDTRTGPRKKVVQALARERAQLAAAGYDEKRLRDAIVESFILRAEQIAAQAVTYGNVAHDARDRRWDRFSPDDGPVSFRCSSYFCSSYG